MSENRRWRSWVPFSQERYELFEQWSKDLELPLGNLIAMCAWAGSKIVIPTLLPDVHHQLKMLVEQQRQEISEAQAEAYFSSVEIDMQLYEYLQQHREEIEQFIKQGGLHKDE